MNKIRDLLEYFRLDNMMTLVGKQLEDKRKPMKEKYYY